MAVDTIMRPDLIREKAREQHLVLTGFYRDSGDQRVGYPTPPSTPPSPTGARHVGSGAESLSPRIENQRHALATSENVGLGEGLSMESNCSVEAGNDVVKCSEKDRSRAFRSTRHGCSDSCHFAKPVTI
jgi:hypothetical protein